MNKAKASWFFALCLGSLAGLSVGVFIFDSLALGIAFTPAFVIIYKFLVA